jgi:cyclophilin family peptidyl-prolyl cis-trans isomerase
MTRREAATSLFVAVALSAVLTAQSRDPTRTVVLAIEEGRASTVEDLRVLIDATRSNDGAVQSAAVRALGRLERREVITDLLPLLAVTDTRAEAANALAQAFHGRPLENVPQGQQEQAVLEALLTTGANEMNSTKASSLGAIALSIGRLPYVRLTQFRAAEAFLKEGLDKRLLPDFCPLYAAARGLESLARISRKLATLEPETVDVLRNAARGEDPKCVESRRNAMAALVASQGLDAATLKDVLKDDDEEVRRLAVLALSGSGSAISDEDRVAWIRSLFSDSSYMVRYEAVRAWTRRAAATNGCQPLLNVLNDSSLHVVLAALDALGDQCRDDKDITDRIVAESRTPPNVGRWQREVHAFVALAKRDRERAAIGMLTFAMHPTWQVRMYAARAAVIVDDVSVLTRLAADPDNNVADPTLVALRKRLGADSDAVFIEVFKRTSRTTGGKATARPYQIIRTAAMALEHAQSTPALVTALVGALERITAEDCETSRDVRLALIERLAELGSVAQARFLTPLLKDVDPAVADAAAALITAWTGKVAEAEPKRRVPQQTPSEKDLATRWRAVFTMENGSKFDVEFRGTDAPLTRARFMALAANGYYNNLTFHRVVPNFVIQGGSPDANEYCGDCPFMRDELGLGMHTRGTLGISTRGRDTGDAQIFINLVDNPRLDHEYTVFARVCGDGMDVVDEIQEGDRITRVEIFPPTSRCGG